VRPEQEAFELGHHTSAAPTAEQRDALVVERDAVHREASGPSRPWRWSMYLVRRSRRWFPRQVDAERLRIEAPVSATAGNPREANAHDAQRESLVEIGLPGVVVDDRVTPANRFLHAPPSKACARGQAGRAISGGSACTSSAHARASA
jgi:hypothetical protein